MAQITIWARGREYHGTCHNGLADSFKECRGLAKAGFGDYMILGDAALPDAILFAWGRIMWHSSQVDLTESEIAQYE